MRAMFLALAAALVASGCSIPDSAQRDGSNILLVITEAVTQAGEDEDESAFLLSDVSPVFNDNLSLTISSVPKNPQEDLTLSNYDTVQLERYTVRYFRSDGRNTEGVDIPFNFQGPVGGAVVAGQESEIAFVLVRHQAKLEPPLLNLTAAGGADIISCFAEVNIFGRTLKGDVVSTKTTVSVTFADFADATQ